MTLAHYTLDDLGGVLSCRALLSFINHLPTTSQFARETGPAEFWAWSQPETTNELLAELGDELRAWGYSYFKSMGAKGLRKPKPRPRPGVKDETTKHIGSEPVTVAEFNKFWNGGVNG